MPDIMNNKLSWDFKCLLTTALSIKLSSITRTDYLESVTSAPYNITAKTTKNNTITHIRKQKPICKIFANFCNFMLQNLATMTPKFGKKFCSFLGCIQLCWLQVAERALYFWNNDWIINLISENATTLVPLVFPALYQSKEHWNKYAHFHAFYSFFCVIAWSESY